MHNPCQLFFFLFGGRNSPRQAGRSPTEGGTLRRKTNDGRSQEKNDEQPRAVVRSGDGCQARVGNLNEKEQSETCFSPATRKGESCCCRRCSCRRCGCRPGQVVSSSKLSSVSLSLKVIPSARCGGKIPRKIPRKVWRKAGSLRVWREA